MPISQTLINKYIESIRNEVAQMTKLEQQIAEGQDRYSVGRALGKLVMETSDERYSIMHGFEITDEIKKELKARNKKLDLLLGEIGSPIHQGYNDFLKENSVVEKWVKRSTNGSGK